MTPEQLREKAHLAYDRAVSKKNIMQTMQSRMILDYAGGVFYINPEFIAFLNAWTDDKEIVLLDSYDIPVQVNVQELLKLSKQRYQEYLNEYALQYKEWSSVRSAKNV